MMIKWRRRSGRRVWFAAMALAGLLMIQAASAWAGSYHVYSCSTPAGIAAPTDGWQRVTGDGNGPWIQSWSYDDCAASYRRALGIRIDPTTASGSAPVGSQTGLYFYTPEHVFIDRLTLWRSASIQQGDNARSDRAWMTWTAFGEQTWSTAAERCSYGCGGMGDPDHEFAVSDANRRVLSPATPVQSVRVAAGCLYYDYGNSRCTVADTIDSGTGMRSNQGLVYVTIPAADFELSDDAEPTASDAAGTLAEDDVHAGVQTLNFNASDEGSGLYHTVIQARDAGDAEWLTVAKPIVDANDGKCSELDYLAESDNEFGFRQPCKREAAVTASLDTTSLRNGVYQLRVLIEDASGNTTTVLEPRRFEVANAGPPGTGPASCPGCSPTSPGTSAPNGSAEDSSSARFTAASRRTVRMRYGARKTVSGRLIDGNGRPIGKAVIEVIDGRRHETVSTNRKGQYRYRLRRGRSRGVTFGYRSTSGEPSYDDTATVLVRVGAVIRVRAQDTTLPRYGRLRLEGKLVGGGKGAQIQVQARDGTRWRTIDLLTTDAKGTVIYSYRFQRATDATFLFRMKMTKQPQVKLEGGASRTVRVHVR